MTEQEKREKAIAKMAVVGCVRNPQAYTSEECEVCGFKEGMCNAYRHATKLYDYILHREEEVQKERTKEIFKRLVGYKIEDDGWSWIVSREDLVPLAKEFGVEVEE